MNIILTNITPPLIPEIAVCPDLNSEKAVVVVRVPQSHQTPHAIAGNTQVYLRTGNRNNPETLARIDEIEWLRDRRRKSEELRTLLYKRAQDRLYTLYSEQHRRVTVAGKNMPRSEGWLRISLCPLYPKEPFLSPPDMNSMYKQVKVPDYLFGDTFPRPPCGLGTLVQDGIVLHSSEWGVYHTELNCFGLYFFRQSFLQRDDPESGGDAIGVIPAPTIFYRLDQFLTQRSFSTGA